METHSSQLGYCLLRRATVLENADHRGMPIHCHRNFSFTHAVSIELGPKQSGATPGSTCLINGKQRAGLSRRQAMVDSIDQAWETALPLRVPFSGVTHEHSTIPHWVVVFLPGIGRQDRQR